MHINWLKKEHVCQSVGDFMEIYAYILVNIRTWPF